MFLQGDKTKYEIQLIVLKALVDKEITQKQVDYFIDCLETYSQKIFPKTKRDLTNYKNFLWWIKSDNVIRADVDKYYSQCSQYSFVMTRKEAYIYFKKHYKE